MGTRARRTVNGVADRQRADRNAAVIPASRPRLVIICLVVAALLAGLLARVWYLQLRTGTTYVALAKTEQLRQVIEPATRGPIVDDTGAALVDSRPELVISVSLPALWNQGDGGAAVLRRLDELDFDGLVSVEYFDLPDLGWPLDDPVSYCVELAQYVRSL